MDILVVILKRVALLAVFIIAMFMMLGIIQAVAYLAGAFFVIKVIVLAILGALLLLALIMCGIEGWKSIKRDAEWRKEDRRIRTERRDRELSQILKDYDE